MEAPREDLFRSTPPLEVRSAEDGRMTLFGHFSVFNRWTEIDSIFEGRFMERIAPGAFSKTLKESGSRAKIMWNHGCSDLLRDVLIAKPLVAREDERGGYYEAELFRGLPEWLYEGLRENVYGASFRFGAVREEWVDHPERSEHNPEGLPERTVTEARVPEWGPVSWPAYDDATAMVRSLSDRFHDLSTPTDRAALVAPGPAGAATPSINPDADDSASHLEGPTIRERRMRALQLRGVLL
jgi:HK97 family phage prohead protease